MTIQRRRIRSPRRVAWASGTDRKELRARAEAHAQELIAYFDDVVSDWSEQNRPHFVKEIEVKPDEIKVVVRPAKRRKASTIFGYVDKGTPPHVIRPKASNKYGLLFFREGYRPKTLPVAQAHVGPGKSTGPFRAAKEVQHPGTEARLFSETAQKNTYPKFRRQIENGFRKLLRISQRT